MKEFTLSGIIGISVMTKVEAETEEEAMEIAESRDAEWNTWPSDNDYKVVWVAQELDGEVADISIEE